MNFSQLPRHFLLFLTLTLIGALFAACGGDRSARIGSDGEIEFGEFGALSGDKGRGSFRFGAATAATQIEDENDRTDWYFWSMPTEEGGMGQGKAHVGDAVRSATLSARDIELMKELGLDAYRFSIEWSKIEPERDKIDEAELERYSDFIDALLEAGIRPMITLHHFSNPIWVGALGVDAPCPEEGPSDENLCGWDHPEGSALILEEFREHVALLAERFGDRVDDWCTINEPVNYIIASYGAGVFPPGRNYIVSGLGGVESEGFQTLISVFRNFIKAHILAYDAIKEHDTVDADGDGLASEVGLSLNLIEWDPVRNGLKSSHPDDLAAGERARRIYNHLFPASILDGSFDSNFDGEPDEEHPEWKGKLDWLGIQYYMRNGVTAESSLIIPGLEAMICFQGFEIFGACLDVQEPTKWIPTMSYEFYEEGMFNILRDFSEAYPELPLVVTEAGIATKNGVRRSENIVRILEQVALAIEEGSDVRGYYHWSLTDNFEWAEGYDPQFGLYAVDRSSPNYERTATEGAIVYREIIEGRKITPAQRETYGGTGPMTPELDD